MGSHGQSREAGKLKTIVVIIALAFVSAGAFGQVRVGSQGSRKTDDEIYLETLLIFKMDPYVNPYVAATLRTRFSSRATIRSS
jgi:hypothetical protein